MCISLFINACYMPHHQHTRLFHTESITGNEISLRLLNNEDIRIMRTVFKKYVHKTALTGK